MKHWFKIMGREMLLFKSNSVALLIFIGAPLVYALLIGTVYRQAIVKDLPIVVVDLDNSPLSQQITDALHDNQYIRIDTLLHAPESLKPWMTQRGIAAWVTLPDGLEADIQQKRHPEIVADINGANMLTGNYAATGIQTTLAVVNAGIEIESLKKKGVPSGVASEQFESFQVSVSRLFNPSNNYLFFLWPGMLATIMQQVFLLAIALSFTKEYEDRSLSELIRVSKNPFYILSAKTIPYLLMGAALWFPMIHLMFPAFQVPHRLPLMSFYSMSVLFMASVSMMGMAVSVWMKTQLKATEVLMVVATPSFIISGQTWPLTQMPEGIQYLAQCIPLTHYAEAFRAMVLYPQDHVDLTPQWQALWLILGVSLLFAAAGLWYRIKKEKTTAE